MTGVEQLLTFDVCQDKWLLLLVANMYQQESIIVTNFIINNSQV